MVATLGYLMGSINYLMHQRAEAYTEECNERFLPVCQLQSFVTTMGVMMTLLWTSILAVQLYQSVVKGRVYLERRVMLMCHVVAWGVPTLVSFGLLAGGELGYSTVTASGWCFVADVSKGNASLNPKWKIALFVFVGGMFVELCTYVIVVVCTVLAACHSNREPLSPFHSRSGQSPEQLSDKQLLVVPMMVVVLRSWGTVYTLSSLISTDANIVCDDPNDIMRSLFSILGILQAIGDPGALGWGTILLYMLRSPKVRGQLWNDVAQLRCCGLRTRCMYRGRRPGVHAYMHKDSRRVSTVIYARTETTPTSPMRNAGRFREEAEPIVTDTSSSR
eukprot:Em0008g1216a